MSIPRREWPTELKMPRLVDEHLSVAKLREAFAVADHDGPPMTLAEGLDWLELNAIRPPGHPPSSSKPPGTRGKRSRRRYATPAGRPGRMQRVEVTSAA